MLAAGEHGAVVNCAAERLRVAFIGVAELASQIEQDRTLSASERHARDAL